MPYHPFSRHLKWKLLILQVRHSPLPFIHPSTILCFCFDPLRVAYFSSAAPKGWDRSFFCGYGLPLPLSNHRDRGKTTPQNDTPPGQWKEILHSRNFSWKSIKKRNSTITFQNEKVQFLSWLSCWRAVYTNSASWYQSSPNFLINGSFKNLKTGTFNLDPHSQAGLQIGHWW